MSAVAKIAKPVMRGMHVAQIKRNLIIATGVSMELASEKCASTYIKP